MSLNDEVEAKDLEKSADEDLAIPDHDSDLEAAPAVPPPQDFPEGGVRAWAVACGASGILFSTFGYINAFGVYQAYYATHQLAHKSLSDISWIGSLQLFFLFGSSLIGGPAFDRYGAKVIYPAAVAQVLAVMFTSLCAEYYQFVLAQGVLGGIGAGMMMAPALTAVNQYFHKNRGASVGLAVAGSSIGGIIFPVALNKMFNNPALPFGWSVRIVGFILLAVLIPSVLAIRARLPPRKKNFFLFKAFTEPRFLLYTTAAFLALLGQVVPLLYLPSFAISHGISSELAFYLSAILNGASFFGRIIPGILADRYFGRFNTFAASCVATGILSFCWFRVTSHAAIIAFAALFGFFSGAVVSVLGVCFAQVADAPQNIGTYLGMGMFVISFSALIGPPVSGALLVKYGGYEQVSIFSGTLTLVGGLLVLPVKLFYEKGLWSKL